MPYAMVSVHSHPKETFDQQKEFLHERIIPMIKSQPGFIAGYWGYEAEERKSNSFIVFATEADARRVAALVKEQSGKPNPFDVRPLSITVVEVVGDSRA